MSSARRATLCGKGPVQDKTLLRQPGREGGGHGGDTGGTRLHLPATIRPGSGIKLPHVALSDGTRSPPAWTPDVCAPRAGGHGSAPCASAWCRRDARCLPQEGQVPIPLSAPPLCPRRREAAPAPPAAESCPFRACPRAPADAEERQSSEICQISVPAQCTAFKYKLREERLTSPPVSRSSESFDHLPNKTPNRTLPKTHRCRLRNKIPAKDATIWNYTISRYTMRWHGLAPEA